MYEIVELNEKAPSDLKRAFSVLYKGSMMVRDSARLRNVFYEGGVFTRNEDTPPTIAQITEYLMVLGGRCRDGIMSTSKVITVSEGETQFFDVIGTINPETWEFNLRDRYIKEKGPNLTVIKDVTKNTVKVTKISSPARAYSDVQSLQNQGYTIVDELE